jgi:hypothetical protein
VTPTIRTLTIKGIPTSNTSGRILRGDLVGVPGMNCIVLAGGATTSLCTSEYANNQTALLLRDQSSVGLVRFLGFTSPCTGSSDSCSIVMDGDKTLSVGWMAMEILVSSAGGTGTGTVTGLAPGSPTGAFHCAIAPAGATGVCSAKWDVNNPTTGSITLTATPTGNSVFAGWSGKCTGTGTCVLQNAADLLAVSANFTAVVSFAVSVQGTGTGTGTVSSTPAGITCVVNAGSTSQTCSSPFAQGSTVTLSASPTGGSTFGGWTGACTATTPTCTVTVNAAAQATARFTAPRPVAELVRALFGEITLTPDEVRELDKAGNNDGVFNLGDLLALLDRTGQRPSPAVMDALGRPTPNVVTPATQRRTP